LNVAAFRLALRLEDADDLAATRAALGTDLLLLEVVLLGTSLRTGTVRATAVRARLAADATARRALRTLLCYLT